MMAGVRVVRSIRGRRRDAENVGEHGDEHLAEDAGVAATARGEEGLTAGQGAVLEEALEEIDAGLLLLDGEEVVELRFVGFAGLDHRGAKLVAVGPLQPAVEDVNAVRGDGGGEHDLEALDGGAR